MKAAGNHAHETFLDSTHASVVMIGSGTTCAVGFSILAMIASSWTSLEAKSIDSIVLHPLLDLAGHGPIHEQHGPNNYCRCDNQHWSKSYNCLYKIKRIEFYSLLHRHVHMVYWSPSWACLHFRIRCNAVDHLYYIKQAKSFALYAFIAMNMKPTMRGIVIDFPWNQGSNLFRMYSSFLLYLMIAYKVIETNTTFVQQGIPEQCKLPCYREFISFGTIGHCWTKSHCKWWHDVCDR